MKNHINWETTVHSLTITFDNVTTLTFITHYDQFVILKVFQTLELIHQVWKDDYLRWNPSDYDGITEITIPAEQVWLPDVAILNRYP